MANNTSTKKLINELESAVDSSRKLLKVFNQTQDVTKDIAEDLQDAFKGVDKKTSKGISDLNKLLEKTNDLTEDNEKLLSEKAKTEADLIKIEKKLSVARLAEIKEKQELEKLAVLEKKSNIQITKEKERQIALAKKEVKGIVKELDAYQKKSKLLNDNRKAYKALAAAQQETTEEGKNLLKTIDKLDKELKDIDKTVGQNQRSVGKYEDAVKGLTKAQKKNADATKDGSKRNKSAAKAITLVGIAMAAVAATFGDNREGAMKLQMVIDGVTSALSVMGSRVMQLLPATQKVFVAYFDNIKFAALSAAEVILKGLDLIPLSDFSVELSKVQGLLKETNEGEFFSSLKSLADKAKEAVNGIVSAVTNAVGGSSAYLEFLLKSSIQIEIQTRALAGLAEQRQILQDISDDDTLGFLTRAKAMKEAQTAAEEFAKKDIALAKLKEKVAAEGVKQSLRKSGVFTKQQIDELDTAEKLNTFLQKNDAARKISEESDQNFSAAYIERKNKEAEEVAFNRDQQEKFRKTERDAYEQELDILEEFTEKKIASNTAIIENEKSTLAEISKAQADNKAITDELLKNSVDLTLEQGKKSIDLQKELSDVDKQKKKDLLDTIDINAITNAQSAEEVFDMIRRLDLGEIEEKRLKEAIKLKLENIEINKKNAATEKTAILTNAQLKEDIALQERKLAGEDVILEDERLELKKQRLIAEIAILKDGSTEKLRLQKQLNDMLLTEQEKAAEAEAKAKEEADAEELKREEEKLALRKKLMEDGVKVIDTLLSKSRDKQNSELEKELDALDARIDDVRSAIDSGNSEASQSLADLEKQKIEAQEKQEKLRKKEIRDQTLIAGLQVLASNDGNVGKTLGDVSLLLAALSNLPSFFDGTEDTGTVAKPLDSNGGRHAVLHDNERVMTAKQNVKLGGISNEDLADLGAMHNSGSLNGGTTIIQKNNKELIAEVREMTKAVKSIPIQNYNYDANGKYHEQVIQSQNKKETIKSRANNIFK